MQQHDRVRALAAYDHVPTRVLVGDRDLLTPVPHARTLAANLAALRAGGLPRGRALLTLERHELVTVHLVDLVDAAASVRSAHRQPVAALHHGLHHPGADGRAQPRHRHLHGVLRAGRPAGQGGQQLAAATPPGRAWPASARSTASGAGVSRTSQAVEQHRVAAQRSGARPRPRASVPGAAPAARAPAA